MLYSRWVLIEGKGMYEVIGQYGRLNGLVASKSVPNGFHVVKEGVCDCEGFRFRKACVHVEAVKIFQQLEEKSRCRRCGERIQSKGTCRCTVAVK